MEASSGRVVGITGRELYRQVVHAGFGAGSILLRWFSTYQAMGVALAALAMNLFILPRVALGRSLLRERESRFGGVVLYPLVVALLVWFLPLHLAAAAWVILAVGDSASNVCGRTLGVHKLPWNRAKSWAGTLGFFVFAVPLAAAVMQWVVVNPETASWGVSLTWSMAFCIAAISAAGAAITESLPLPLDDNISVGAVSAVLLVTAQNFLIS